MPSEEEDLILWKKGELTIGCSNDEVFRGLAAPLLRHAETQGWAMEGRLVLTIVLGSPAHEPPPRKSLWFFLAVAVGVLVALMTFFALLVGIASLASGFRW